MARLSPQNLKPKHRIRNKEETRIRLIEAATEVFSKIGYDAATTKVVALRAGVNEALIQRYFEGKEGLLYAVVEGFKDRETCHKTPPLVETNLKEDIAALLDYHLRELKKDQALVRVIVSRAIVDSHLKRLMKDQWRKVLIPQISDRISYWKKRGVVPKNLDTASAAFCLLAIIFELGFFADVVMNFSAPDLKRLRSGAIHFILTSLQARTP